jgi:hypothetical protein
MTPALVKTCFRKVDVGEFYQIFNPFLFVVNTTKITKLYTIFVRGFGADPEGIFSSGMKL